MRDIERYRLVALLSRRSISDDSPLDHYTHGELRVAVEGRSAFHLMAGGPLEGAAQRVD